MKPKNRVYCNACGRSKMLFETEKKALLFIKFNSDEILVDNVVTPTRAYYCESCMGWHVTHIKDGNKIEQRIEEGKTKREEMENWVTEQKRQMKLQLAEKRQELEPQYKAHNDNIYKMAQELLERAKKLYQEGNVREARESLNKALKTSLDIKSFKGTGGGRFKSLRREINNLLAQYRY